MKKECLYGTPLYYYFSSDYSCRAFQSISFNSVMW